MAKKKEVKVDVESVVEEVKVEVKLGCAHCNAPLSNESFVEVNGKKFCSLGCSNS